MILSYSQEDRNLCTQMETVREGGGGAFFESISAQDYNGVVTRNPGWILIGKVRLITVDLMSG